MELTEITESEFYELYRNGIRDFSSYTIPELEVLHFNGKQITSLPNLPNIKVLYCANNDLTHINLPDGIEHLSCGSNKLKSIAVPLSLQTLLCGGNPIEGCNYSKNQKYATAVYYAREIDRVFDVTFTGSLEDFYQQKWIKDGEVWAKNFYNINKNIENETVFRKS